MSLPAEVMIFLTGAGGVALLQAIISALRDRATARGKRLDREGLLMLSRALWKSDSHIQRGRVEDLGGDPGPLPDDPAKSMFD